MIYSTQRIIHGRVEVWNFSLTVQLDIELNTSREILYLQVIKYYFVYYTNTHKIIVIFHVWRCGFSQWWKSLQGAPVYLIKAVSCFLPTVLVGFILPVNPLKTCFIA